MQRDEQWSVVLGMLDNMQQQLAQLLQQQSQLMSQASLAVGPLEKDRGTTAVAMDAMLSNSSLQRDVSPPHVLNTTTRSKWWWSLDSSLADRFSLAQGASDITQEDAANDDQLERNSIGLARPHSVESFSSNGEFVRVTPSCTGRVNTSQDMVLDELWDVLTVNREVKSVQREQSNEIATKIGARAASVKRIHKFAMNPRKLELLLDACVGTVIVGNAIFIGMSMDAESASSGPYLIAEITFVSIFWAEMILKVFIHGFRKHFCGNDWLSNTFDATVISADTVQIVFLAAFAGLSSTFNASIFRVVRLVRLARILRLLRSHVFKDLLSMIQGMMGGLSTLLWAVAFFVIFNYVVAIIFRDTLGRDGVEGDADAEIVMAYFENVPRSMFTIFRCSFGDCSTKGGTPLFEHVTESYGALWSLSYSVFLFIVVIGLFNVISAIFVESTLASAASIASVRKQAKLDNKDRWAENVVTLLTSVMMRSQPQMVGLQELVDGEYTDGMLSELLRKLLHMRFPRYDIDWVVRNDARALHALTKLDIDPSDHRYLSDILDPDNTGGVSALSLVDGLKRLRGEPRRSDIITIDLMMRSSQKKVDDIWRWTKQILRKLPDDDTINNNIRKLPDNNRAFEEEANFT